MKRSLNRSAPVVTLLSPSPAASIRAREWISQWTGFTTVAAHMTPEIDDFNNLFRSSFLPNMKWNSVFLQCPRAGTILHWLSVASARDKAGPLELLAVQEAASLVEARNMLAESIHKTASIPTIFFKNTMGFSVTAKELLGRHNLPVLDWSRTAMNESSTVTPESGELKEVAIPAYDDATYPNGTTFLSNFSQSPLVRPVVGLYQFPSGMCLRPLPAAKEDRQLSPPSLIFHTDTLKGLSEEESIVSGKIGYSGNGRGQIMVRHRDLQGLDVRFCENPKYSSMFSEAQESLLAGSLSELQSKHVLGGMKGQADPKINRADCWAEFRANLSRPAGFVPGSRQPRIAKPPDIPYE
jgi:hypothetical protein